MPAVAPLELFHPETRAEWRHWLAKHHAASRGVQLVLTRRDSGVPSSR